MKRRSYLVTASGILGTTILAGCAEEGDSGSGDANGNGDGDSGDSGGGDGGGGDGGSGDGGGGDGGGGNDQSDIELLDHGFYEEEFSAGVRGTARNNTDGELSYVEAEAVFLDADGTQIGEGLDNVSDLAAGREWEFDCMFLGDDASRIEDYEIEVSSGF